MNSVDIQVISKAMNATLLLPHELSIYRQDPSREVDLAWQRLGDLRLIPLTREEVTAIGKDPDDAVRFPESFGWDPKLMLAEWTFFTKFIVWTPCDGKHISNIIMANHILEDITILRRCIACISHIA